MSWRGEHGHEAGQTVPTSSSFTDLTYREALTRARAGDLAGAREARSVDRFVSVDALALRGTDGPSRPRAPVWRACRRGPSSAGCGAAKSRTTTRTDG